jgi:integrase
LISIREQLAKEGLSRATINSRIGTLKRFAKWCVARDLAPPTMLVSLQAVENLRHGEGGRETSGRRNPVSIEVVEATLPFLPPLVKALVRFIRMTGCRVGEARKLTTAMIDRSGPLWKATLLQHKTARFGRPRVILIGEECQAVIRDWLRIDQPNEPIFSPSLIAQGKQEAHGKSYHRVSLSHTVNRATARAFPHPELAKILVTGSLEEQRRAAQWKRLNGQALKEWNKSHCWSLAQLRHTRAVELREQFGVDVAATVLGHAKVDMSLHYSATAIKHAERAIQGDKFSQKAG